VNSHKAEKVAFLTVREQPNTFHWKNRISREVKKMRELKGWPFEPLDDVNPTGIWDGPGPGAPD